MKNKFLTIAGIAICAIALGLNLQNAFDGYGVKKGTLHPEVLAQTTTGGGTSGGGTSGGGTSGMGGGGTGWSDKESESCQTNYGSEERTVACDYTYWKDGKEYHSTSVKRVCDRVADASKKCTPVACGGYF